MMLIGETPVSPTVMLIRKRWPSALTAYCCIAPMTIDPPPTMGARKSFTGVPDSNVLPSGEGCSETAMNDPSSAT